MFTPSYSIHDLVETIIVILNTRDPYTFEHSWRVSALSEAISREMNVPNEYKESIHMAAHLHDIGKIGIPDYILNKTGKLTNVEYEKMKGHSEIGYEIVYGIENLKEIALYVRHHHERWDGKGYPSGLSGKDIPFGARIIAVADTFDAITSHRTYSKERSYDWAYEEIKASSGTQLCPEICDSFLDLKDDIPIILEEANNEIIQRVASKKKSLHY
ncbi:HD-GYP domain-containing protein [Oceanispirochaeta sp. M1]|uniref:HD-GYP domain-containing protein n=1 Tax=Oceanispirochaeta sp. M1 TaxID=2283433 RepID=UPI000E092A6E|nr:HD-GYP domain-containing protein [Oceanispirochaeta sp. M1]NPD75312.1 HD-GYP domain-containing protein [Oceanispirochaeta sp. M1]RDG28835.1 HD-GYP domain-containing protein [Oceanispirochaeta sp. M1]